MTLQPLNVPADPGRRRFLCAASALAGMLGTPTLAQVGGVASAADQGFDPSAVATDFWARPRIVWLRAGGVGFYPGKGFTHVDDGRLRRWKG